MASREPSSTFLFRNYVYPASADGSAAEACPVTGLTVRGAREGGCPWLPRR